MSDSVTSRLRTATMPGELCERTWAPEMPQCTDWMRHPDISSASSTARRIESVVDSMFTTMPFFIPVEGAEPRPTISNSPSSPGSATMQATLEVPISRATMRFVSGLLLIPFLLGGRGACTADRKTIAIAQIHIAGCGQRGARLAEGKINKPLQTCCQMLAPEAQHQTVVQGGAPGPARVQLQAHDAYIA